MRIIAGKYKSKKIKHPQILQTRPMMDFVKESLFNSLSNHHDWSNCHLALDLFAGSGQLGIEALSRGTKKVIFNDLNRQIRPILRENLSFIPEKDYEIWNLDYLALLKNLTAKKIKLNLLIIDPPFKKINFYYQIFNFIINTKGSLMYNTNNNIICESQIALELSQYQQLKILFNKKTKNKFLYILSFRP